MKTTLKMLSAGIMVAFYGSIGYAQDQIIYSQDFTSGSAVSLNGTAPTYASSFAGGSSSATWTVLTNNTVAGAFINQNGKVGSIANTALLPFTPQSGFIYTIIAGVTFTGNPGSWLDLGFALHNPAANTGSGKMNDTSATGADGVDWAIFTPAANGEQFFSGPSTGNAFASANNGLEGTGGWRVTLTLDTMADQWTTFESFTGLSGAAVGKSYTSPDFNLLSTTTNIVAVALGNNAISGATTVTWNSWELTATPEPSAMALTGLGLAGAYVFRRQRK